MLVGCERSGIVRDAFLAKGHNAWSCDLAETRVPGPHLLGDVRKFLEMNWDLFIAHPECRYLCNSGVKHLYLEADRWLHMIHAAAFFKELLDAPIRQKCIENPIMHGQGMEQIYVGYTQIVQPYNFGEDVSKATCFWLDGLEPLQNTGYFPPRIVEYNGKKVKRWGNQAPSGADRTPPGADRSEKRSNTHPGIADAMAEQWGGRIIYNSAITC